jgi:hypothetical protein
MEIIVTIVRVIAVFVGIVAIIGAIAVLVGTEFLRRRKNEEDSIPPEVLRGILESMDEPERSEADPAKREQLLLAKAGIYQSLKEKLRVIKGDDPEVLRLREAARKALQEGRLQDLEALLQQAQELVHAAGQALCEQESEIAIERACAARLQYNPAAYRRAANLFGEAARLTVTDAAQAREYQFQQAFVLDDLGDEFGDNDALREVIALYRQILSGLDRMADPQVWVAAQNNLGCALQTLGEREDEGGTTYLHEALAAYRAALTVYETSDDSVRAEAARRCIAQSEAALERGRKNRQAQEVQSTP